MESYEEMLKIAIGKITRRSTGERFETPLAEVATQGTQTIIVNFLDICGKIRRDCDHLLKFLSRELAAPGSVSGPRAVMQGNVSPKLIQNKIEKYVSDYVICKTCKRPDTKLVKEDRIFFIKCESCGAKNSVK